MTREQAIEIINKHFPSSSKGEYRDLGEALLMAINSLEAWDEVKHECWDEGHNFAGECQGVWVRFKDIERIMDKHLKEVKE